MDGPSWERQWLEYFNPCGGELAPGVEENSCRSWCLKAQEAPSKTYCGFQLAYEMAGYILDGRTVEDERNDLRRASDPARRLFGIDGVMHDAEDREHQIFEVSQKAAELARRARLCAKHTRSVVGIANELDPAQRAILRRMGDLSEDLGMPMMDEAAAQVIDEYRTVLREALDAGMENLGVVVRQALGYGVITDLDATEDGITYSRVQ